MQIKDSLENSHHAFKHFLKLKGLRAGCSSTPFRALLFFPKFTHHLDLFSCFLSHHLFTPLNLRCRIDLKVSFGSLLNTHSYKCLSSFLFFTPCCCQLWRSSIVSWTSTCPHSVKMQRRGAGWCRTPSAGYWRCV